MRIDPGISVSLAEGILLMFVPITEKLGLTCVIREFGGIFSEPSQTGKNVAVSWSGKEV
jgi:hypothetical protein